MNAAPALPGASSAAARRGVYVLLANSALMSAGFFMLIPLLSVHLTQNLGFSGAAAGAILAVRQLTQQGLMVFGGALADRVGYRPIIAVGMLVRALGFFGFAVADTLPVILASAIVAALGGALFEATGKAALASLVAPEARPRTFSLSSLAGGIGTTGGPLLGVALLPLSFAWVGIASGAFFFAAFVISALLLPPMAGAGSAAPPLRQTLATVSRDKRFLTFTALLTAYWLLHNQIYISVPLWATRVTGGAEIVGLLYAVNAGAGLLLQYPLVTWASRRASPTALVAVGMAIMGAGLGLFALTTPTLNTSTSTAVLVMCTAVTIYAAGRSLVEPSKDVVTTHLAPPNQLAAYFGVSFLALAIGGSTGNYLGGWLYDLSITTGATTLPWLSFAAFGLLAGAITLALRRGFGGAAPAGPHKVGQIS
ncbi:MAG TPA: MFS transporter [Chloroflexota bacterium]|nr:MFS transporter [Chloroflexota bacterium]